MIAPTGSRLESILITHIHPDHILLEGERLRSLPPTASDTALITPVHIPSLNTLIETDIADIDTHLWIEEVAATGTEAGRAGVAALRAIGAKAVIPGHHESDSPNDATVFDATIAYLDSWEKARAASANAEEFRAKLLVGTEDLGFAFAIDRGVAAAFPA